MRVREERAAAGEPLQLAVRSANGARAAREQGASGARGDGGAKPQPKPKPKPAGPSKNRLREQRRAEQAIEEAEAALSRLEDKLADPAAWATKYESAKSQARHTAARRAVEQAYARLEELVE